MCFVKTVVEKVGSDDGATRLPEEYKELEKVLCIVLRSYCHITIDRRRMLPKK